MRAAAACLALLLAGGTARAGEAPRVGSIEVVGASRMTRGTVLAIAGVREGDPWVAGAEREVLRRVAVPVLQLCAAYGFSGGRVLPGFSLGFAF